MVTGNPVSDQSSKGMQGATGVTGPMGRVVNFFATPPDPALKRSLILAKIV